MFKKGMCALHQMERTRRYELVDFYLLNEIEEEIGSTRRSFDQLKSMEKSLKPVHQKLVEDQCFYFSKFPAHGSFEALIVLSTIYSLFAASYKIPWRSILRR
jgi:hypothetical protein